MEKLAPEKRTRAVPAHLASVLIDGERSANEFDQTLAQMVAHSFLPAKAVSVVDETPFNARLLYVFSTYDGPCILIQTEEPY